MQMFMFEAVITEAVSKIKIGVCEPYSIPILLHDFPIVLQVV